MKKVLFHSRNKIYRLNVELTIGKLSVQNTVKEHHIFSKQYHNSDKQSHTGANYCTRSICIFCFYVQIKAYEI